MNENINKLDENGQTRNSKNSMKTQYAGAFYTYK